MPRKGIMLCYPLEERRLARWLSEDKYTIIQPKLDGDRGRVLFTKSGVQLLSSEENSRNFSLPHLVHEFEKLADVFTSHGIFELDGEFYVHDLSHEEIHGICSRTTELHPQHERIEYHIFDHISTGRQIDRLNDVYSVQAYFQNFTHKYIRFVPSAVAKYRDKVMEWYKLFTDLNYEGIILRRPHELYVHKRSTNLMKFKPKRQDEYTITGVKEEYTIDGQPKGRVGSLELIDPEGTTFSVSAGLNDEDRSRLWAIRETLPNRRCIVHYQAVSRYGVPKFATDLEVL